MLTKEILLPTWIMFPELTRSSAILRLGTEAEEYHRKWVQWLRKLSETDYREYAELFPEPMTWLGMLAECHEEAYAQTDEKTRSRRQKEYEKRSAQKYTHEKLCEEFRQGRRKAMRFFWKPQPSWDGRMTTGCFSQWWRADFYCNGQKFSCMEQMMMASKARLFGDEDVFRKIMQSDDPAEMKKLGRLVRNFDNAVWNKRKFNCILVGNYCKFASNPELREYLLSTGDEILAEASPYDCVWGIGLDADNACASDPDQWRGENLLGFALMQVRDEIRLVFANASLDGEKTQE